jgi:TRAP-type mannitol/chloroaromatic compound transport system substrate-binding protein
MALLAACGGERAGEQTDTVAEAKTFTWKLVTSWPKNYPGLGTGPEKFADMVEAMSDGRLKVRVYGAGEMVPALEVFDAVSQGTVEMGHGSAYYWKGKIPAAPFFTTVPFGLNAQEMNAWLNYGGGLELWREAYEPFNLIPFPGGNTGVQMAGWFNKKIETMEDIEGLSVRIPGLGGEIITRAGGQSVTIPGGEIYTAMQTNLVDATEWVSPYNDQALGLHQVGDYYYYPGWHEPGPTLEFIVNEAAYNRLPDDLKAMVRVAAQAINQDMLNEYTARNMTAMEELVEKHGVDVRPLPDEVIAGLRDVTEQVLAELAEKDPLTKRVYESQMAFKEKAMAYHAITEEAFYDARRPEPESGYGE